MMIKHPLHLSTTEQQIKSRAALLTQSTRYIISSKCVKYANSLLTNQLGIECTRNVHELTFDRGAKLDDQPQRHYNMCVRATIMAICDVALESVSVTTALFGAAIYPKLFQNRQ